MTKRELERLLAPKSSEEAGVTWIYTPSEDGRKVKLEFNSDTPMGAMDLIEVLCAFINWFIVQSIKEQTKS